MVLMHEKLANMEVTLEDEKSGLAMAAVIWSSIYNFPLLSAPAPTDQAYTCCAGACYFKMSSFF